MEPFRTETGAERRVYQAFPVKPPFSKEGLLSISPTVNLSSFRESPYRASPRHCDAATIGSGIYL